MIPKDLGGLLPPWLPKIKRDPFDSVPGAPKNFIGFDLGGGWTGGPLVSPHNPFGGKAPWTPGIGFGRGGFMGGVWIGPDDKPVIGVNFKWNFTIMPSGGIAQPPLPGQSEPCRARTRGTTSARSF